MQDLDDVRSEGDRHLAFVKQWCDAHRYEWLDITDAAETWRKALCLQLAGPSGPENLLLAIEAGAPSLYVSGGVLKGLVERSRALEVANSWTRSNPAFPCFLTTPAPTGDAALIQQLKLPLALMQDAPAFVASSIDHALALLLDRRANANSEALTGTSFTAEDHPYLLAASL